jgi:putative transposase
MPRKARRLLQAPYIHAMNRGNRREVLFERPRDYEAFLNIMCEAPKQEQVRLLSYSLMPNHWHLVLWPKEHKAVSTYLHWVTSTHVRRWLRPRGLEGTGHVYQDRFKSIPILNQVQLLLVLRYVEANPVRAGLVTSARDWPWGSLSQRTRPGGPDLTPWPVARPDNWEQIVDDPLPDSLLEHIRKASNRSCPILAFPRIEAATMPKPDAAEGIAAEGDGPRLGDLPGRGDCPW